MPHLAKLPRVPAKLVFMDKSFETGAKHGHGLVNELRRNGMSLKGNFMDFGCGWGRLAYGLLQHDFAGHYTGIDILESRVDWLAANVTPLHPNYEFIRSAQKNDRYNKAGEDQRLVIADVANGKSYDNVFMGSVFTHMWADDIRHYLRSVSDVMAVGGTFIFTCFALDLFSRAACERGGGKFTMPHRHDDVCRYQSDEDPLYAIAYDYDYLLGMIADANLSLDRVNFGNWSGRPGKAFQDWFVVKRLP